MDKHDTDIPLHKQMVAWMNELWSTLWRLPHMDEAKAIFEAFEIDRNDDEDERCSCGGWKDDCEACDGMGYITNEERGMISNGDSLNKLNDRWYAIYEELIEKYNALLIELIV